MRWRVLGAHPTHRTCAPLVNRASPTITGRITTAALISTSPCERDREDAPAVDLHADLVETGLGDELIHLLLRPAAHDPRPALAIDEDARDEFQLRVIRLVRVDEV